MYRLRNLAKNVNCFIIAAAIQQWMPEEVGRISNGYGTSLIEKTMGLWECDRILE